MDFLLHPLTLVTFFPLVGVLVILFINRENKTAIRWSIDHRIDHLWYLFVGAGAVQSGRSGFTDGDRYTLDRRLQVGRFVFDGH